MIAKHFILCFLLQLLCAAAQPESPQQPTCNSCCQGQPGREGNPGIPGVPGSNGHPGNIGQKGDKGESSKGERGEVGVRGDKGDSGSPGLKGEQDLGGLRGSPGKTGPVGVPGSVGSPGVKGDRGDTGAHGEKGDSVSSQATRVSAFNAVRPTGFTPSSNDVPLPFEQFHTNVGDDFDLASGRFTCEVPGIYMFTYSLLTYNSQPSVNLMKDDTIINSVYHSETSTLHDSLSNAAVLQLQTGQQVWLRCVHAGSSHKIFSASGLYTSFSGVLLHEI